MTTSPGEREYTQAVLSMVATSAMLADKHHQRARTSSHLVIRVQQLETRCAEMQKEMDDLTLERSRLLGYVRASATQISQSGVRLVGLSSDHIQLVRSYASALSSGACAGDSWSGNLEQAGKKRMLFLEQEQPSECNSNTRLSCQVQVGCN